MASRPEIERRYEGRKTVAVILWLVGLVWFLVVVGLNWHAWSSATKQVLPAVRDSALVGLLPGVVLYVIGRQVLKRSFVAQEEEEEFKRDADFMQYFHRKGRVTFEEIQQEFGMQGDEIKGYLINLGGRRLFRGYIDWRNEEIVSIGEVEIGDECPGCSSPLNYIDLKVGICDHCGLQVFK
jgi:hypothetical protein